MTSVSNGVILESTDIQFVYSQNIEKSLLKFGLGGFYGSRLGSVDLQASLEVAETSLASAPFTISHPSLTEKSSVSRVHRP